MRTLKPNKRGINRLITAIANAKPEAIKIQFFNQDIVKKGKICGTAYCVAGWANAITKGGGQSDIIALAHLLFPHKGVNPHAGDLEALWSGHGINMSRFDEKLSGPRRKAAVLSVLEHYRDTGKVDWRAVTPQKVWNVE